ncbi:hypothetical protein B0O80DRAFT_492408 [Mortierella sp. GBAus27b]|nr:hypothetical protein B0O80DRAFT_492408 [Mortierella sp. GBAus27b]
MSIHMYISATSVVWNRTDPRNRPQQMNHGRDLCRMSRLHNLEEFLVLLRWREWRPQGVKSTFAGDLASSSHQASLGCPMEGWLITYVYGPLMMTLLDVQSTVLKMTEFKMSNESLYQDLLVNDLRHDGILRVDKCNMDVMIMEAKPTKVGARDDFGKAWGGPFKQPSWDEVALQKDGQERPPNLWNNVCWF